jgi:hypothetical protein
LPLACARGSVGGLYSKSIEQGQRLWQSLSMDKTVIYVVFGALMAWSIYRRVRRNIGRQPLRPNRSIVRLVILSLVSLGVIAVGVLLNLKILAGFGGGLLPGVLLGFLGLKLTRFETTEEGHFYIPDTRIGVALSVLLTGRLIYRMIVLNDMTMAPNHPPAGQSPLTYLIVGLTCGYYIVYSIGLIIHAHDRIKQQNAAVPPTLSV